MSNQVILKANRDKPLRQKHPWVFSGALDRIDQPARTATWSTWSQPGTNSWRAVFESPLADCRAGVDLG